MNGMAKEKRELPEGYVVPIRRSLTQPMLWMGVPRTLLILEFVLALIFGVLFKTIMVVFVIVGIHFVCRFLTHNDPQFHEVFLRYLRNKSYYDV